MDFNRLTEKSQEAIRQAQAKAIEYGNQQVDVEHLLLAMLEQEGGLAPSILARADVPLPALHGRLEQEIAKLPKVSGSRHKPGPGLRHEQAFAVADSGRRAGQATERRVRID